MIITSKRKLSFRFLQMLPSFEFVVWKRNKVRRYIVYWNRKRNKVRRCIVYWNSVFLHVTFAFWGLIRHTTLLRVGEYTYRIFFRNIRVSSRYYTLQTNTGWIFKSRKYVLLRVFRRTTVCSIKSMTMFVLFKYISITKCWNNLKYSL